jgi:hypothetical protein
MQDYEMDIPVTYCDKEGTGKFDVVLGDVQTNERFNFNLFSVAKMLLKDYKLKGTGIHSLFGIRFKKIPFDIVIHTINGALYCARFIRKLSDDTKTANLVVRGKKRTQRLQRKFSKSTSNMPMNVLDIYVRT